MSHCYVLAMGGYGAVGAQLVARKNATSPDESGSYGLYPSFDA